MKIESRGKYAGVKVHLDADEAKQFLEVYKESGPKAKDASTQVAKVAVPFAIKLGSKINKLLAEVPTLFEDRTDEQIAESMKKDLDKILAQQHAMSTGKDWKEVKSAK